MIDKILPIVFIIVFSITFIFSIFAFIIIIINEKKLEKNIKNIIKVNVNNKGAEKDSTE